MASLATTWTELDRRLRILLIVVGSIVLYWLLYQVIPFT